MGTHMHFAAILGVELDPSEYRVTETKIDEWCDCMIALEVRLGKPSTQNFCHECGEQRPEPRQVERWSVDAMPAAIQEALKPLFADPNDDLMTVIVDLDTKPLINDLTLMPIWDVRGADSSLYLGKVLARYSYRNPKKAAYPLFGHDPQKFAKKFQELGVYREPSLHLVSYRY